MEKVKLHIDNIPAVLWGNKSDKLFLAVHGNMSHKEDDVIAVFAEEAAAAGYQVLSFDLPQHGERREEAYLCKVQNCVHDLHIIMAYVKSLYNDISIFACSMGAYFSLLEYANEQLNQSIFLSPVVNMERIISNMMNWFNVSEERLEREKEVPTPIGQTLYWDYYCYVKDHPIVLWNIPTSILYASEDDLCEYDTVSKFTECFKCDLHIMKGGEHYFHTENQLEYFRQWLKKILVLNKIDCI